MQVICDRISKMPSLQLQHLSWITCQYHETLVSVFLHIHNLQACNGH